VVGAGDLSDADFEGALKELGRGHIAGTWSVKKSPCGYIAQGAIDAALKLRDSTGIRFPEILAVDIRVPQLAPFFRAQPTGDVSGKFSYQYPIACALLDGQVTKWSFSDESYHRRELQVALSKVAVSTDPASGPHGALVVRSGAQELVQAIEIPTGHVSRPVPLKDIEDKYLKNAEPVLGLAVAKETAHILLELEKLPHLAPLVDKLAKRG
jgi:2-methylcitrate dehydratase PrpD